MLFNTSAKQIIMQLEGGKKPSLCKDCNALITLELDSVTIPTTLDVKSP